ncbi:DUF2752 domain-containing protein [Streptomyces sp. NPDC090127]|uniref:DUF2752 domain-containing protein n=1 Tax=Streptomyces sp. NPDC090127 TaxID=3365953 RepID=UPI00381CCC36
MEAKPTTPAKPDDAIEGGQPPLAPAAPAVPAALAAPAAPVVPAHPGGVAGPATRSLGVRLLAPLGALAGVGAAFAYVAAVDPNEPGHYPVCPLLRFTGLYCPGCGGLRSAHAFVHGELSTAFGANALAVVGYGLFAVVMAVWLIRAVRAVPMRVAISPAWWWGIGSVLALFTLVRNLPFGSALAP